MFQVTNVELSYGVMSNIFNLFVGSGASTGAVRQFKGTHDSYRRLPMQWMNPYIRWCTIAPSSFNSRIHLRISRIRVNPKF